MTLFHLHAIHQNSSIGGMVYSLTLPQSSQMVLCAVPTPLTSPSVMHTIYPTSLILLSLNWMLRIQGQSLLA